MQAQIENHCSNPFFPCINTNSQIKIKLDICIKGQTYSICENCWIKIADSEKYQWTTPEPQQKNQPLEVDWSTISEQKD